MTEERKIGRGNPGRPRAKKRVGYVARSASIPPDLDAWLVEEAERQDRSISWMIADALREYREKREDKS